MKQIWDGLIMEHPVISVIGALLVVALTCGAFGPWGFRRRVCPGRELVAQYPFARHVRATHSVAWRSGSAGALQAQGRGFKSLRDHQKYSQVIAWFHGRWPVWFSGQFACKCANRVPTAQKSRFRRSSA